MRGMVDSPGYTSAAQLAIQGSSAGGIFVGRAITSARTCLRRPLMHSPLSDMIRFETSAGGAMNIPEFGSITTEDGFRGLFEMSPYHKIVDSTRYPAVLSPPASTIPALHPGKRRKWPPGFRRPPAAANRSCFGSIMMPAMDSDLRKNSNPSSMPT